MLPLVEQALLQWLTLLLLLSAGAALLYRLWRTAAQESRAQQVDLVRMINARLPQTQCGRCAYPGCRPYAEAIAAGEAINKCPPGGPETIQALARLTGQRPTALDPAHGLHTPPQVARIRESECIGCTKCIQACPVDAILGAARQMHTVIVSECTGCDLCVQPCPVDCIDMVPGQPGYTWPWLPVPREN